MYWKKRKNNLITMTFPLFYQKQYEPYYLCEHTHRERLNSNTCHESISRKFFSLWIRECVSKEIQLTLPNSNSHGEKPLFEL